MLECLDKQKCNYVSTWSIGGATVDEHGSVFHLDAGGKAAEAKTHGRKTLVTLQNNQREEKESILCDFPMRNQSKTIFS